MACRPFVGSSSRSFFLRLLDRSSFRLRHCFIWTPVSIDQRSSSCNEILYHTTTIRVHPWDRLSREWPTSSCCGVAWRLLHSIDRLQNNHKLSDDYVCTCRTATEDWRASEMTEYSMFKYPFHFDNNNNNKHRPPDLTVRVCAVSSLGDRRTGQVTHAVLHLFACVPHSWIDFYYNFHFLQRIYEHMYTHAKKEEDAHQFFNK